MISYLYCKPLERTVAAVNLLPTNNEKNEHWVTFYYRLVYWYGWLKASRNSLPRGGGDKQAPKLHRPARRSMKPDKMVGFVNHYWPSKIVQCWCHRHQRHGGIKQYLRNIERSVDEGIHYNLTLQAQMASKLGPDSTMNTTPIETVDARCVSACWYIFIFLVTNFHPV